MTYKKLPEPEKQEILRLYQAGTGTIPSLAEQYGISTTTVRRILKGADSLAPVAVSPALVSPSTEVAPDRLPPEPEARRSRRRSSVPSQPAAALAEPAIALTESVVSPPVTQIVAPVISPPAPPVLKQQQALTAEIEAELSDLTDLTDDELNEDLDDDDLDDDLDPDEEALEGEEALWEKPQLQADGLVHIVPLADASLPKTCYLVVDRVAELITRPLKDFGELGQFPEAETQQKTLPVFDNHRVAKRFANPRTQRVIKLPDSRLLQNTSAHLWAKGITRLLVNGQVYSLEATEV
jgi:transposase-like protein